MNLKKFVKTSTKHEYTQDVASATIGKATAVPALIKQVPFILYICFIDLKNM